MTIEPGLRAAIIGASGIGKHHAKWLHVLGCKVCAIVGTSDESLLQASAGLRAIFPFDGGMYRNIKALLQAENPDLVHVCTPPHLHHEHILALATHHCHVLCEKPLTWDDVKPPSQLLAEAQELTEAVKAPDRVTAVNLQYAAAPAAYRHHADTAGWPNEAPHSFFMHMDSRRPTNTYEIIWRELSPHTLSVMMAFCGPGEVDFSRAEVILGESLCRARFDYQPEAGPCCACELVVGNVAAGPMTRRFGINGRLVDYEGRNDNNGVFRTYLRSSNLETASEDFMFLSMRDMVRACRGEITHPLVTLSEGLRNQAMQLGLLSKARRED